NELIFNKEERMSLLTDTDLRSKICSDKNWKEGSKIHIYPFSEDSLTPVGYDLRVGNLYSSSLHGGPFRLEDNGRIVISPGDTVLITTLEKIGMPKDKSISALIMSKVSKVSKGLSHISTPIDPDYDGEPLIAMNNYSRSTIELLFGEPFCTIVFFENKSHSTKSCGKVPGRLDIFVNKWSAAAQTARKKEFVKVLIPISTILFFVVLGYVIFGNQPGFVAMVAAGVGLAGTIQSLIVRR
ncbi:MAG: hypothetical protein QME57_05140, partial [Patescibacteria group bacterium]|nr:hypothetical protein [Patescibacteria group bacterium]